MAGRLYVGTSGFAYDEWRGSFYPEDLDGDQMLPYYASRLPSVEINYTFRRFPGEKTVLRWTERSVDAFRFALKANQRITHTKRLRDADREVADFLERVRPLGDRLGPILFQCPPSLRFDRGLLESFLGYLPPIAPYAMEFRHDSWRNARELLADNGVAWCHAETDETPSDAEPVLSEPFAYLRFRRESYGDGDLERWATRVEAALRRGDVYAYFKHEADAPRYAEQLLERVSA